MVFQKHCPGCFHDKSGIAVCPVCGYDESLPRPPLFLPHGIVIGGQYRVGRVLGQPGGFGITYLGWDVHLQQRVAIKEFLPRDIVTRHPGQLDIATHTEESRGTFEFGKEQFLREARIVAKLDHPNVVRVRSFFNANGTAYLVMDYYEGLSLGEYLSRVRKVIEPALAVPLIRPVLEALQFVHEHDVVHRDLKPHNIYLATVGKPIVLDFGAARQAAGERQHSMSVVLTDGYAPLEQYQRRTAQGPWTDVYGAAATLYRMLTGVAPPTALDRLSDDPLERDGWAGIPATLVPAMRRAMALMPEARFQSAAEFIAALTDFRPLMEPSTAAAPVAEVAAAPESAPATAPVPAPIAPPEALPPADPAAFSSAVAAEAFLTDDLPGADEVPPTRRVAPLHPPSTPEAQAAESEPPVVAPQARAQARASGLAPAAPPKVSTAAAAPSWTVLAVPMALVGALALLVAALVWQLGFDGVALSPPPLNPRIVSTATPIAQPAASVAAASPSQPTTVRGPLTMPQMRLLPAGTAKVGDDRGDDSERPAHRVPVEAFALASEEVTVEQFGQFVEQTGYVNPQWSRYPCDSAGGRDASWAEPGYSSGPRRPVVCVSAVDAQAYAAWLSAVTGTPYRLPTEAEWEYAARAGSDSRYWWGDRFDPRQATCAGCPEARTGPLPVGRWPRNAFGLADTAGNVREWTCSAYAPYGGGSDSRCADAARDGAVLSVRGGAWIDNADGLRSARRAPLDRQRRDAWTGFRLAQPR